MDTTVTAKTTILVVEDEMIIGMNLCQVLRKLGHEVPDVVPSGEEAIAQALELRPDLILMDIHLRDAMDGIDAASAIGQALDIPIIYLTAYADEETLKRASLTTPFGYIVKPFEVRELQAAIEIALHKSQIDQRIKAERQWLLVLLNSMNEGVVASNPEGLIKFMNPVAAALIGWTQPEAVDQPVTEVLRFIDEETHQVIENPLLQALQADHEVVLPKTALILTRNGKSRSVAGNATPIYIDQAGQQGAVIVFRDVSEQKKIEQMQAAAKRQAEEQHLLEHLLYRIHQATELDGILDITVAETRQHLDTDRVLIYQFKPDWSGTVTSESVRPGVLSILATTIDEPCFRSRYVPLYQQGRVRAIADIYTAGIEACHLTLLKSFGVRANLVVPILQGGELWGLLIAHHCQDAREWSQPDINLLSKLAVEVGIAIRQAELYQKWQHLATSDGLTGLANRRHFDTCIQSTWQTCLRTQLPLTLILADIDFFKQYNDTYGHPAGDECLRQVAQAIQSKFRRANDLVARYGGEEFAVLLLNTKLDDALDLIASLQTELKDLNLAHQGAPLGQVTLSVGVASIIPSVAQSMERFIENVDQALYRAKTQGRNRIGIAPMGK